MEGTVLYGMLFIPCNGVYTVLDWRDFFTHNEIKKKKAQILFTLHNVMGTVWV